MIKSVVIQPEAFAQANFTSDSLFENAIVFYRALKTNCVLVVDNTPECNQSVILTELIANIKSLDAKHLKRLEIYLVHAQQQGRIVRVKIKPPSRTSWNCVCDAYRVSNADTIIVEKSRYEELKSSQHSKLRVTSLSSYISSDFEDDRHKCQSSPVFDNRSQGEFDRAIVSLTRLSKRLVFYDKQIGACDSPNRFFIGINHIVKLWLENSIFRDERLTLELYTVLKKSNNSDSSTPEGIKQASDRIRRNLVERLANQPRLNGVKCNLDVVCYLKKDNPTLIHDRYIETDFAVAQLGRGFDIFSDGILQTVDIVTKEHYFDHVADIKKLVALGNPIKP